MHPPSPMQVDVRLAGFDPALQPGLGTDLSATKVAREASFDDHVIFHRN